MKRGFLSAIARLGLSFSLVLGLPGFEARSFVGASATAAPLAEIRERGYLIVAVKDNLRPLGFRDENGEFRGYEIDIARRLAQELFGSSEAVLLVPVSNGDRLPWVMEDEVDLTIAHVTQTPSRERVVNFSLPYYLDGTAIVTRDASVEELSDLQNRRIAVLEGSSAISVVRYLVPSVELVGVSSYQAALESLDDNLADAFAGDRSVLTGWVQAYPRYRQLPEVLSTAPLAVVMPKGLQYDELRRQVNGAIERWRQEGWLAERAAYWGL